MKFDFVKPKNSLRQAVISTVSAVCLSLAVTSVAYATDITLIQVSDLHGNLVPHAGMIKNFDNTEYVVTQGGGVTKMATVVKQIRASVTNSLTLAVGDSIHGSAETLFTMGDAMMPAFNALGLDAYTPGNWEFAYGPAVFRNRFTNICKANPTWQFPGPGGNPGAGTPGVLCPVIPPNARIMTDSDGQTGVVQAAFPVLADNLYNGGPYPVTAPFFNKRALDAYKIFEKDGVKIAVIGITAAIIPQQPAVFGRTFHFTQGTEELPGLIKEVRGLGASVIVIQSELGLPQNVQIAREYPDVDVILSAHSHEVTIGAILADADGFEAAVPGAELTGTQLARLQKGAGIVVEAGEDLYVGRLDLKIVDGKVQNFVWEAVPVNDQVAEDPEVAALVAAQEQYFTPGDNFKSHTFMPFSSCNAYAPGFFNPVERCGGDVATGVVKRGLRLVDPLDIVVGRTDILLHRHETIEGAMNNFIADAVLDSVRDLVKTRDIWASDDIDVISMTNGFRFDTVILPPDMVATGQTFRDGRTAGDITLRDLWSYFPVPPAMVAADFAGVAIADNLNGILSSVFNPNPFLQRGGWYVGLSSNVSQKVDVVRLPASSSGSRILETRVNGASMDPSKRYVIASCYGHTNAIGRACRIDGGANTVFFALEDGDDYTSAISMQAPLATKGLISNQPGQAAVGAFPAPDHFMHPVHALRLLLDKVGTITEAEFGVGRVKHVNANVIEAGTYKEEPIPESTIPGIVQPIEGVGPAYLDRGVIVHKVP